MKLNHVPYKGQGQVINDLLGGSLESAFLWSNFAKPYIDDQKIKALAVVSPTRIASLPNIPTFKEIGVNGLEFQPFNVLLANNTNNTQELVLVQQAMSKILDNKETRAEYENALRMAIKDHDWGWGENWSNAIHSQTVRMVLLFIENVLAQNSE